MNQHVVVILTDLNYLSRARQTIQDVRIRGDWRGDIILITIDFDAPPNFIDYYSLIPKRFPQIDVSAVLKSYETHPISPTCDNREYSKLAQWNKFYVFSEWFKKWEKVLYFDAGMRVLDSVELLFSLDCDSHILVPEDGLAETPFRNFGSIIDQHANPAALERLFEEFGDSVLDSSFFLNCMWIYDTKILNIVSTDEMIDLMNRYPICRCNEMTIMNLVFHCRHNIWKPLPEFVGGKILFDWTDRGGTWRNYSFIKYPRTLEPFI